MIYLFSDTSISLSYDYLMICKWFCRWSGLTTSQVDHPLISCCIADRSPALQGRCSHAVDHVPMTYWKNGPLRRRNWAGRPHLRNRSWSSCCRRAVMDAYFYDIQKCTESGYRSRRNKNQNLVRSVRCPKARSCLPRADRIQHAPIS